MKKNAYGRISFENNITLVYSQNRSPFKKINLINKSVQEIIALFLIKVFRDKTILRRHHYGTQN